MPRYFTQPHQPNMWEPAKIFSFDLPEDKTYGLVVLNQPLPSPYYTTIWNNSVWVVAADGGATQVRKLNASMGGVGSASKAPFLRVDTVIGDLDSLEQSDEQHWLARGAEIIQDPDQESTDFTKAVKYLKTFEVPEGASHKPAIVEERLALKVVANAMQRKVIVVVGGLGGRVDQGMSVLHHLFMFQEEDRKNKIYLLSPEAISFVLKSGVHMIRVKGEYNGVKLGQHVGIIPLKGPSIITTKGLKWDVENWPTHMGGQVSTSNQVAEFDVVTVATTADVLFTIDIIA